MGIGPIMISDSPQVQFWECRQCAVRQDFPPATPQGVATGHAQAHLTRIHAREIPVNGVVSEERSKGVHSVMISCRRCACERPYEGELTVGDLRSCTTSCGHLLLDHQVIADAEYITRIDHRVEYLAFT